MKKPITIIFNDIHIKNGNEEDVFKGVQYLVDYANNLGVSEVICNGDIFDSRSFQRLSHLKCWEKCLELFKINNIVCHTNVGNHDKSLYNKEESFLDPYKYHPSIKLYPRISDINICGVNFTISPFFEDKMLCEDLKLHNGSNVLVGHWSCDGSTYLGKTDQNKVINKKLLSKWDKVYLGHYHNYHEVNENTTHLPSLLQDNFGEDNIKGFTIIYDDLSYEVVKGKFKEFVKVCIDINETSIKEVSKKVKDYENFEGVVRFEITGDDSKLKSVDKSIFTDFGIDVKLKFDKKYTLEQNEEKKPILNEVYNEVNIRNEFKKFCEDKGYDYAFGSNLLNNFFSNK